MSTENKVNLIQAEVDELVAERTEIIKKQEELREEFNKYDVRLCEINGALQTLVKLFGSKENKDADTESKTESDTSSN